MKYWITGPRGFVGAKLMAGIPGAAASPSLRGIAEKELRTLLEAEQPDVIVHTAAISDIPTCAAHPEESYWANVQLPVLLARCNPGAKLVMFSSDQVYTGLQSEGPYTEAAVAPGNLYASEKIEMEQRVLEIDPNAVMLRAEWMYDWVAPKGNYIRNVLSGTGPLQFSSREFRGVTYVREVVENIPIAAKLPGGAYNFGSKTDLDLFTLTRQFLDWMGKDTPILDAEPKHNLWMDCSKAAAFGVQFSRVEDGLRRCAADYGLKL